MQSEVEMRPKKAACGTPETRWASGDPARLADAQKGLFLFRAPASSGPRARRLAGLEKENRDLDNGSFRDRFSSAVGRDRAGS